MLSMCFRYCFLELQSFGTLIFLSQGFSVRLNTKHVLYFPSDTGSNLQRETEENVE